jgi:DNA modification methylase
MTVRVLIGDCRDVLRTLPDGSVHCVVSSPPYFGLRDYGVDGQIGLEQTPDEYVAELVAVFREARRVLRDDGTLWLNLGDSYATSPAGNKTPSGISQNTVKRVGSELATYNSTRKDNLPGIKQKDLIGIPWRVAFALQADGWYLRQDIIWHKPNPMPESVTDRCTKAHEYVFLLAKSARYWYDDEAIRQPLAEATAERYLGGPMTISGQFKGSPTDKRYQDEGKKIDGRALPTTANKRSVWTIPTQPYSEAHFATMAPELARTCILAGCPEGGTVLDPFGGAGTTGLVADQLGRDAILIELNPQYAELARNRIANDAGMFSSVAEPLPLPPTSGAA